MRLIDADELHELLNWTFKRPPYSKKTVREYINMARTVDAEPVRHGHWIEHVESDPITEEPVQFGWRCSRCGRWEEYKEDYCNCGAKMDESQSLFDKCVEDVGDWMKKYTDKMEED